MNDTSSTVDDASEVHLLVHPGFGNQKRLTEMYEMFARMLPARALLFALMHHRVDVPHALDGELYAPLRGMREYLGRRMVIAQGDCVMFEKPLDHGPQLDAARWQAKEQGYAFSPDVPFFAWGETSGSCVPRTAQNANMLWKLAQPTLVLPHLTNKGLEEEDLRFYHEERISELQALYSRIAFPPWEMTRGLSTQMRHLLSGRA